MICAVSYPLINNRYDNRYKTNVNFKSILSGLKKPYNPTIEELIAKCLDIESTSHLIEESLIDLYRLHGKSSCEATIKAFAKIAGFYETGEGKSKRPAIAKGIARNAREFATQLKRNEFFDS